MPTVGRYIHPLATSFTISGATEPNSTLEFFESDGVTPAAVYTDNTGIPTVDQPVPADLAGRFEDIYLDVEVEYTVTLRNASGGFVRSFDNVFAGSRVDASNVFYTPPFAESVSRTVTSRLSDFATLKDLNLSAGDGSAEVSGNIQTAIDNGLKNLLITPGVSILEADTIISSQHNGLTIDSVDASSILRLKPGVSESYRAFRLEDAVIQIEDITFKNLYLDGNKDNRSSSSTRGIWANGFAGTRAKNIIIENARLTGFDLSGLSLDLESATLGTIISWGNGIHGIDSNSTRIGADAPQINAANLFLFGNGGYGLDCSSANGYEQSTWNIINAFFDGNTQGNWKLAGNVTLNVQNVINKNSVAKGFRMANASTIHIGNMYSENNADDDVDISGPGDPAWAATTEYIVGEISVNDSGKRYICTTPGTSAGSGGPTGKGSGITDSSVVWDYFPITVHINNWTSRDCGSVPFFADCGEIRINNFDPLRSTDQAFFVDTETQSFKLISSTIRDGGLLASLGDFKCEDQKFIDVEFDQALAGGAALRLYAPLTWIGGKITAATNGINTVNMSSGERLTLVDVDFTGVSGNDISDQATPTVNAFACNGLTLTEDAYTPTNVTPDRAFDADTVAVAELADIVGTLIADLQLKKIIA